MSNAANVAYMSYCSAATTGAGVERTCGKKTERMARGVKVAERRGDSVDTCIVVMSGGRMAAMRQEMCEDIHRIWTKRNTGRAEVKYMSFGDITPPHLSLYIPPPP